jgi:hypothetical protein
MFRHTPGFHQCFQINAGGNPNLGAEQSQFLGRDIARRAVLAREGATTKAGHRGIKPRHTQA